MGVSNFSATEIQNGRRNADTSSNRHSMKRNRDNATGDSMRETRAISDVKSSNVTNSEYSFYDRGFREYSYHPLKKTRVRPSTAGVQRVQEGKLAKFNIL
jgi:hypothetical protein